jgi:hypothetical protein
MLKGKGISSHFIFERNASVTLKRLFNGGFSVVPARIPVLVKVGKVETVLVRSNCDKGDRLSTA